MKNLYKIFFLLIAGPVVFLFIKPLKNSRWFRWIFIGLHTLFLTYCTLFLFNRPSWRWADEKSLVKKINNTESRRAYQFISDNFLLIDNSFDKVLVPHPEGDESDSTSLVLTNRKTIGHFLQLLNEHISLIDGVVIDIGFGYQTSEDSLVKAEIVKLYSENKILLSVNPPHTEPVRMVEDEAAYGNISEKGKDNLFTSHTIFKDGYYSLAYKLYCQMNGRDPGPLFFQKELFREKTAEGGAAFAQNTFFPQFRMTNEDMLRGKVAASSLRAEAAAGLGAETNTRAYYYLSQPLSSDGKEEFHANLQQRKKDGRKNIVFIGAFASPDEDVHQTLYGNLHGATIILNILYSLQKKDHILKLSYLLFLLAGFFLLSVVLVYSSLGIRFRWPQALKKIMPFPLKQKKTGNSSLKKKAVQEDSTVRWFKNLFDFLTSFLFVKELPVTLLILFSILVVLLFGHWPNVIPLLIYMAGMKVSLDYAAKHLLEPHQHPDH